MKRALNSHVAGGEGEGRERSGERGEREGGGGGGAWIKLVALVGGRLCMKSCGLGADFALWCGLGSAGVWYVRACGRGRGRGNVGGVGVFISVGGLGVLRNYF